MTTKKMIHAFCIVLIARAKTNQDKTKQNIKCHYQQPLSNGERFCRAGLHANFFFFFLGCCLKHRLSNVSLQCPSNQFTVSPPPSRALMLCCYTTCNYYMHRFYFVIF